MAFYQKHNAMVARAKAAEPIDTAAGELAEVRHELRRLGDLIQSIVRPSAENDLTPNDVRKIMRVSPNKVLAWIKSGKLKASNISAKRRPLYRIARAELDRFRNLIAVEPERKVERRRSSRHVGKIFDLATGEPLPSRA
jgi:hypothetical protein